MIEHYFNCPHCFQQISVLVDPSVQEQAYVEDCEVCCNPLLVHLEVQENKIIYFEVTPAQ